MKVNGVGCYIGIHDFQAVPEVQETFCCHALRATQRSSSAFVAIEGRMQRFMTNNATTENAISRGLKKDARPIRGALTHVKVAPVLGVICY